VLKTLKRERANLRDLTQNWGSRRAVALYLDRCQVDTPDAVVSAVWKHFIERRHLVAKVIDFGAGDGRFALAGKYRHYTGYEIDANRCRIAALPPRAELVNRCAFSESVLDADLCIGNPPYVRNQDLPSGWRERAAAVIQERLALASTKVDGLVALVIPYEWVSRPSARALRDFVKQAKWDVTVYRLRDETFNRVLTTASITVIDKRNSKARWEYFEEDHDGNYRRLKSASGGTHGVLGYLNRSAPSVRVRRGLSPGTQEVLTLTEGERARFGLQTNADVVPCVTSLRNLNTECANLTDAVFRTQFRETGLKCWLIRTDRAPSARLQAYLDGVQTAKYQTSTCLDRDFWWKFAMPDIPSILVATGFRGARPKVVRNTVQAVAVGGVSGVYGLSVARSKRLVNTILSIDVSSRIVPHSNGLRKLEIGQLATLLNSITRPSSTVRQ
jgi:tRNA1(Val) A37 N6-methylase TrmN6